MLMETAEVITETTSDVLITTEQAVEIIELLTQQNEFLGYICGIAIFGVVVILCRYVYKFFNMFF